MSGPAFLGRAGIALLFGGGVSVVEAAMFPHAEPHAAVRALWLFSGFTLSQLLARCQP